MNGVEPAGWDGGYDQYWHTCRVLNCEDVHRTELRLHVDESLHGDRSGRPRKPCAELVQSATRQSAQFAQAADSVEVDQAGPGAGAGARDLDGTFADGLYIEA